MARLLRQILEGPEGCRYLPDRQATTDTRIIVGDTADELEQMLIRGWRRFGPVQFRPTCGSCGECVPLRIPVAEFRPSRSQRRAARACAGLRVIIGAPRVDEERLALYRAWHSSREQMREWPPNDLDAREYQLQFAFPHPAARELAYYDAQPGLPIRLVGLAICDETPRGWNATYFFYDPAYARRSIGVANILRQIRRRPRARNPPRLPRFPGAGLPVDALQGRLRAARAPAGTTWPR